ncbi:hypothetical protein C8F04DRAFT_1246127 [Mycena alexandri]|uniref:Uncharacterized protein n=1 Tax=Mycena alexandri TaxID=1745969 RepID=A0AAD6WKX9_9AGAR|nr:hypothetical protein C8F04DRAFT_1246127 [Mycena alexandri]
MGYGRYHGPGQKCWPWYLPWARRRREENLARGTTHGHSSNPSGSKDQKGFISGIWAPFGLPKGLLQSLDPGLSACEVGATSEHIKFVLSAYRAACKLALVRAFAYWAARKLAPMRAFGGRLGWYWAFRKPCPRAVGGALAARKLALMRAFGGRLGWYWAFRKPCPRAVGGALAARKSVLVRWVFALVLALLEWPDLGLSGDQGYQFYFPPMMQPIGCLLHTRYVSISRYVVPPTTLDIITSMVPPIVLWYLPLHRGTSHCAMARGTPTTA